MEIACDERKKGKKNINSIIKKDVFLKLKIKDENSKKNYDLRDIIIKWKRYSELAVKTKKN